MTDEKIKCECGSENVRQFGEEKRYNCRTCGRIWTVYPTLADEPPRPSPVAPIPEKG